MTLAARYIWAILAGITIPVVLATHDPLTLALAVAVVLGVGIAVFTAPVDRSLRDPR